MQQHLLIGLQIDVESDEVVFNHLRSCGMVKTASSEEQTECQDLGGQGYSVSQTHRLPCPAVKGWLPSMLSITLKDLQQLTPKYGMHIESSLHAKPNNLTLVFASQVSGFSGRDQFVQIVRLHHAVWSVVGGSFMHTFCKW